VSLSILRRLPLILFVCLLPAIGSAQHLAHGASGLPHGIPDFGAIDPQATVIPVGESRTLSGVHDFSTLAIHGTVTLTGTVTVDNVLIYADGFLACTGGAIVVRDRAINLATDPEQFGQGMIGFGKYRGTNCTIRSQNPSGVRGHVLFTQRADVDIDGDTFMDLGRTCTDGIPLNPTYDAAGVAIPLARPECQIGRYALHFHHVFGPFPATSDRQFRVRNAKILRPGKWGGVAHNAHHGLFEGNRCEGAIGACFVEENGSETDNRWITNYAGQIAPNPAMVDAFGQCEGNGLWQGTDYDPFGLCGSGFWFRGINQVFQNNTVEDARVGVWWGPGCIEFPPPGECLLSTPVTIPKFPGADTSDPTQLAQTCKAADGSPVLCRVTDRTGLTVSGNTFRRTARGFEMWWSARNQRGGPPFLNTTFDAVKIPVFPHYSDVQLDGVTATGCDTFIGQFNDATPVGFWISESFVRNATVTCSDAIYKRVGQLHQAPLWRISDSTLNSPNGVRLKYGGEQVVGVPESAFVIERTTTSGPIFTIEPPQEAIPTQRIVYTANQVNGQTFTRVLPDGSTTPPPVDCVVSAWSEWSAWTPISATQEQRTRTRTVVTAPANGGTGCPPLTETETRAIVATPPPPDLCKVTPLVVTGIKWPSGQTGNKSGTWNSGNFTLVEAAFKWAPLRFEAKDTRGCVVSVAK
jgi:hypothetical protein